MKRIWTSAVILGAALAATPALADRDPKLHEREMVEQILKDDGFVTWERIVLLDEGPSWMVRDARRPNDDDKYDVRIDAKTMLIVKRDKD